MGLDVLTEQCHVLVGLLKMKVVISSGDVVTYLYRRESEDYGITGVRLSVCLFVCLSVCLSVATITK